jgi:pectinesterase
MESEDRVKVEEGVVFGRGGGRELRCDVYTPLAAAGPRPGLLLLHGGGWRRGDRSVMRGYGLRVGREGFVCVAAEYRLIGESPWPAAIHDVKAALRWMRANASQLGIDPQKIAVSGNSAGGHLSLILAGTPGVPEFEGVGGNPAVSTEVAACIAYYAPALLYSPERELPEYLNFLFGAGYSEATAKGASPLTHVSSSFPPTMLITGNKDELVPKEASFRMYQALFDAGVSTELHVYADAPHGFDAISEFGRQTATLMALFLDRYVLNPRVPALPVPAAATV